MSELKQGHLPDDFPGRVALGEADINTFAQARKQRDSEEGLTGVPGIGKATATKIEERLAPEPVLEAVTDEPDEVEPAIVLVDEPAEPLPEPEDAAVEEPKKAKTAKYEYDISDPISLIPLLTDAWKATKGLGDAGFAEAQPEFRLTLLAHAIDVIKTGVVSGADSPIAAFERKINELK